MTSEYETEVNLENRSTQNPRQLVPESSETAYDRLTCYGFVRRYVRGKIVADIGWKEIGYGSRLLAESAEYVEGLTNSPEAVEQASATSSAPNVGYRRVNLPELSYSEGYFDVVVAFGVVENLEHPEGLVREAKRVLKQDGVFVISALDKQTNTNDRRGVNGRRELYVPEFRELLEEHFGHVRIYRQGAVAGGFVFPASEEITGVPLESARFSLTDPDLGAKPPTTRSVIAVCSDAEASGQEEQPYLLVDRDRRVFDECEDHAEDVELLRGEIQQIQETEVQAFLDLLEWQVRLAAEVNRHLIRLFGIIRHTGRWLLRSYHRQRTRNRFRLLDTIGSMIQRRLDRSSSNDNEPK